MGQGGYPDARVELEINRKRKKGGRTSMNCEKQKLKPQESTIEQLVLVNNSYNPEF